MDVRGISSRTGWMGLMILAGSVFLAGCGSSANNIPVSGKVVQGGKAFTKRGGITFYPDKSKGNESTTLGTGEINDQGDYIIKSREQDGVPPGWYKVTIASQSPSNPKDEYSTPKNNLDPKYASESTTPLAVEVKAGQDREAYTLKVQ